VNALFRKVLQDGRFGLLIWCVVVAAPTALYLPLYSSIGGNAQMQSLIDSLPSALTKAIDYRSITTGSGYTQSTYFGLIGFLLISVAAIRWGAEAIGGDEETGILELTLAHGVSRTDLVVGRYAALVVRIAALALAAFLAVLAFDGPGHLGLDLGYLVGTAGVFGALALAESSFAFVFGAIGGRSLWGVAGGALVTGAGYVFNAVANVDSRLDWLYRFSPYHWAFGDSPLQNGLSVQGLVGLLVLSAVAFAVAVVAFRRRDVGV
jgi:ABC-2 type transport system permease protein